MSTPPADDDLSPERDDAGRATKDAPAPTERLQFTVSPALPSVDILLADNVTRAWEVLHQTYTVCTILDVGRAGSWRYRNGLHYLDGDGVMLMEPGEVHANSAHAEPTSFRVLLIDPELVFRAAQELGMPGTPHFRFAQVLSRTHPDVHRALRGLHEALEQPSTPLEIQSLFARGLRLLFEECAEAGLRPLAAQTERPAAQRARDFIHEHVGDNVALGEVVEAAGSSSQFQLIRSFTATVGIPPHAYQIQLRVMQARALLAGGMPPAEVAAALGFADQSHLARHFVRVLGVTPGAYARATARIRRSGP